MASATKLSLLERVLADRRDDEARRVYADWLSGRGDPRGEFIHLQLDRARGLGDVSKFEREVALLETHREQWGGPLDAVAASIVFERGFPACVQLDLERAASLLPRLSSNLAWGTVEQLFVRESPTPIPASVLAPLIDAPSMRDLTRLAAPLDILLGLAAPRLRYWREVTVLNSNGWLRGALDLCGHLPRLTRIGVRTSRADSIKSLCTAAPFSGRVGGLEVLFDVNVYPASDFAEFYEYIDASALQSLHWVETALSAELYMSRSTQGGRWSLEGDVYAIDEMLGPLCDDVTLYWDPDVEEADSQSLRELFERGGATVRTAVPTRARCLSLL